MKLIDLLVKELPKRGGWPKGVCGIIIQGASGLVYGDAIIDKNFLFALDYRTTDYIDFCVTRDQYEAALARNDGWIEWGGGECPVESGTLVDIKDRDGYVSFGVEALNDIDAEDIFWRRGVVTDKDTEIIAYRPHRDINSRANDDRLEQDVCKLHHVTISVDGGVIGGAPFNSIEDANDYASRLLSIDPVGESDLNECIGQDGDAPCSDAPFPPEGIEIEYSTYGQKAWNRGIVTACGESMCIVKNISGAEQAFHKFDIEFRPGCTESEKRRDQIIKSIKEVYDECPHAEAVPVAIYDAIAAGKIPGVKLEEK